MTTVRRSRFVPIALAAATAVFATACGDDDDGDDIQETDSAVPDGGRDAANPSPAMDAGMDAGRDADIDAFIPGNDGGGDAGPDASVGVTSSAAAYLVPVAPGVQTRAILTVGDTVGTKADGSPYRLVGIPDGLGAYDNGDGTFTLLVNHELPADKGVARAHGGKGAFVSSWVIDKATLRVQSGKDVIQNVQLWNPTTSSFGAGSNVAFGRFCSADLPAPGALFNSASGLGYEGRIFFNGEETGNEGRALAHVLTGTTYELPRLGKTSFENVVAHPASGNKTIVVGLDDSTPGQVYVYVGDKTNSGTPVEKAGLTNGKLYGVAVTGAATEDVANGIPAGAFTLADLGNVENVTGAALQTASEGKSVTAFNRPEDGAWDPAQPNDFYFVTTASVSTSSRLWRLRFTNIAQPELGGTVEAVLDGSEGQRMLDNLAVDERGHIILTEDVGGNDRVGKIWRYTIGTDNLTEIAQHDPALFMPGAPNFITNDEESSGVIDATDLLGAGWFLLDVQAHLKLASDAELEEPGQLVAIFDPGSM